MRMKEAPDSSAVSDIPAHVPTSARAVVERFGDEIRQEEVDP